MDKRTALALFDNSVAQVCFHMGVTKQWVHRWPEGKLTQLQADRVLAAVLRRAVLEHPSRMSFSMPDVLRNAILDDGPNRRGTHKLTRVKRKDWDGEVRKMREQQAQEQAAAAAESGA